MIQLNLLPDVKLEYIRAQKLRSLVTGIAVIVTGASIVILVALLVFSFTQKRQISHLKSSIASSTSTLQGEPNLGNILTVQNQLTSLNTLYGNRPAVYRLFTSYLGEITPEAVSLDQLNVNLTQNTMTMTGSTDNIVTINKFVDILKLTTYSVNKSKATAPAFTGVVLTGFGINNQAQNPAEAASFTINLGFAPTIFNTTENVSLTVPNLIVSHFEEGDSNVFSATSSTSSTGGQ